jgi:hypothetical protein
MAALLYPKPGLPQIGLGNGQFPIGFSGGDLLEIFKILLIAYGDMGEHPFFQEFGKRQKGKGFSFVKGPNLFHDGQYKGVVFPFMLPIPLKFGGNHDFFFCGEVNLDIIDGPADYFLEICPFRLFITHTMIKEVIRQFQELLVLIINKFDAN